MSLHRRSLSADQKRFIADQKLFFVATAPLSASGHVNVSPKGLTPLIILDDSHVAYPDYSGSGNETGAHVSENGRITIMFCAFTGEPNILRLYGRGSIVTPGHPEWTRWHKSFGHIPGLRQIILVELTRVAEACGFGVPLFDFVRERDEMEDYWGRKSPEAIAEYHRRNNAVSIDGLPTGLIDDDF